MIPNIGDILYNFNHQIGLVTEVEHLSRDNYYLIKIEWYVENGHGFEEIYRVGSEIQHKSNAFLKYDIYKTMISRCKNLTKIQ